MVIVSRYTDGFYLIKYFHIVTVSVLFNVFYKGKLNLYRLSWYTYVQHYTSIRIEGSLCSFFYTYLEAITIYRGNATCFQRPFNTQFYYYTVFKKNVKLITFKVSNTSYKYLFIYRLYTRH